jgi:hypothetical protein
MSDVRDTREAGNHAGDTYYFARSQIQALTIAAIATPYPLDLLLWVAPPGVWLSDSAESR